MIRNYEVACLSSQNCHKNIACEPKSNALDDLLRSSFSKILRFLQTNWKYSVLNSLDNLMVIFGSAAS